MSQMGNPLDVQAISERRAYGGFSSQFIFRISTGRKQIHAAARTDRSGLYQYRSFRLLVGFPFIDTARCNTPPSIIPQTSHTRAESYPPLRYPPPLPPPSLVIIRIRRGGAPTAHILRPREAAPYPKERITPYWRTCDRSASAR